MFTKTEQKKLLKVKNILEEIWDGKLSKYHVTPYQAKIIADGYNKIVGGNVCTTIDSDASGIRFIRFYGTKHEVKTLLLQLLNEDLENTEDFPVSWTENIGDIGDDNEELNAWLTFEDHYIDYIAKELNEIVYNELKESD